MLTYKECEGFIVVQWRKRFLGRIYKEQAGWVYKPQGCGWTIESEPFSSLSLLKMYLEGK